MSESRLPGGNSCHGGSKLPYSWRGAPRRERHGGGHEAGPRCDQDRPCSWRQAPCRQRHEAQGAIEDVPRKLDSSLFFAESTPPRPRDSAPPICPSPLSQHPLSAVVSRARAGALAPGAMWV